MQGAASSRVGPGVLLLYFAGGCCGRALHLVSAVFSVIPRGSPRFLLTTPPGALNLISSNVRPAVSLIVRRIKLNS